MHVASLGSLPDLTPLRGRRHLGAILVNASPGEASFISALGRPVVSMGTTAPDVPKVDPENEAGASAA